MGENFPVCPLCASKETVFFCERLDGAAARVYFKCRTCYLLFLSPSQRLTLMEERKHYDSHRNDPKDQRYLKFLNRLAEPLSLKLKQGSEGLDFGCGPGPAMSFIFGERGFKMENYDPVYFPEETLLSRTYDFVTCSEVIEHFFNPGLEFIRLEGLVKKGGFLGVMTGILQEENAFLDWWYPKDPTHVCFYQKTTLEWIALRHGWKVEFPRMDTALFSK